MTEELLQEFPRSYGGYRLTGLLGSGGSADVYRAEVPGSISGSATVGGPKKEVAIRRIARVDADRRVESVLLEESRIWVSLRHPNIVSVVDLGQHGSDWFLVLELVDGASCDQVLNSIGPFPVLEALLVVEKVALALGYAHRLAILGKPMQVVHRDVKPANILLSLRGDVKLTDFGIAHANDRIQETSKDFVRGSLYYLSPEQVRRERIDGRSDLFSLGCTLHRLVTGDPLIDAEKEGVFKALRAGEIPPPPDIFPPKVAELLADMTAADPEDRPFNGDDVASRVRELLTGQDIAGLHRDLGARVAAARAKLALPSGEIELGTPAGIEIEAGTNSERTDVLGRGDLPDKNDE